MTSPESFARRVERLPRLGIGISTEFGASQHGLNPMELRRLHPDFGAFLEVGVDLDRGMDAAAEAWVGTGAPTTYHFLDANLEDPTSLTSDWMAATATLARRANAAWLCGDAGLWHVGPSDRGHGLLQPPILEPASAELMAQSVRRLREATGFEVLPENPPAHVYLGRLHLLDYYGRVGELADSGLLVDIAHLAVYQRVTGHDPLQGFRDFPWWRVVEIHVAGGSLFRHLGKTFVDDDHGVAPLPEVWEMLEAILDQAPNLRAIVVECERNPMNAVIPLFTRVADAWRTTAARRSAPIQSAPSAVARVADPLSVLKPTSLVPLQRFLFRNELDVALANAWRAGEPSARAGDGLDPIARDLLLAAPIEGITADHGGRRSAQVLGNVSLECSATVALAMDHQADPGFVAEFVKSADFHDTVTEGGRLPPAFARYAVARVAPRQDPFLKAVAYLEQALVGVRRAAAGPRPPAGTWGVSVAVAVVACPEGTLDGWLAVLAALRGGTLSSLPRPTLGEDDEFILLSPGVTADAFKIPTGAAEILDPGTASLLRAAALSPLEASDLVAIARDFDVDVSEVRELTESLVRDGVLLYGEPSR